MERAGLRHYDVWTKRPIPELKSGNFMQRPLASVAMNSPIQGTAADIMKLAMVAVDRELRERHMRSRIVLQVHDELLVETYRDEAEEVVPDLNRPDETCRGLKSLPSRWKPTPETTGWTQNKMCAIISHENKRARRKERFFYE